MTIVIFIRMCRLSSVFRLTIHYLVLLSLVAPFNSGAAEWMSLSMSENGELRAMLSVMASSGHHATTPDIHRHSDHADQSEPIAHQHEPQGDGHSEQDCESECLSCSNHCSNLALPGRRYESQITGRLYGSSHVYYLSRFVDPLLRPPISV